MGMFPANAPARAINREQPPSTANNRHQPRLDRNL